MNRVLISGGRVVDPASRFDAIADVCIAEGRVLSVGKPPDGFQADVTLEAGGCVVCPGFVDLRARPREPGAEHKATIASESLAAVAGGITTLCVPPDTEPVLDTRQSSNSSISVPPRPVAPGWRRWGHSPRG